MRMGMRNKTPCPFPRAQNCEKAKSRYVFAANIHSVPQKSSLATEEHPQWYHGVIPVDPFDLGFAAAQGRSGPPQDPAGVFSAFCSGQMPENPVHGAAPEKRFPLQIWTGALDKYKAVQS